MGLDLGIVRRRKGPAYEACAWDDVCWWRNCWAARDVILRSISTYDKEKCEAPLTIGAVQKMLENLIAEAKTYNLDDCYDGDDALQKIYLCIGDLGHLLYQDMNDYEFERINYDYRLIDSY